MERAKPIEPGCRAMIIRAPNNPEWVGRSVTVVTYVGLGDGHYSHLRSWAIDPMPDDYIAVWEKNLLRIDDPDIRKQIESEKDKEATA